MSISLYAYPTSPDVALAQAGDLVALVHQLLQHAGEQRLPVSDQALLGASLALRLAEQTARHVVDHQQDQCQQASQRVLRLLARYLEQHPVAAEPLTLVLTMAQQQHFINWTQVHELCRCAACMTPRLAHIPTNGKERVHAE